MKEKLLFFCLPRGCSLSQRSSHHITLYFLTRKFVIINFSCHNLKMNHLTFCADRVFILLDCSLAVKAAPHECVIRTSQP